MNNELVRIPSPMLLILVCRCPREITFCIDSKTTAAMLVSMLVGTNVASPRTKLYKFW